MQFLKIILFIVLLSNLYPLSAQWMYNGLPGKIINAFLFSGDNFFAGLQNGGVYLSVDNGAIWNQTSLNGNIQAIVSASTGTGGTNLFAGVFDGGVFLSTNNGLSWSQTSIVNPTTHTNVLSLLNYNNKIFVGTSRGIFCSSDNGANWDSSGLHSNAVLSLVSSGSFLIAGTKDSGAFRSSDSGISWSEANNGLTTSRISSLAFFISGTSGINLLAGTENGIFRSGDNGASWTHTNLNYTYVYSYTLYDPFIFAGTFSGVYYTTDGINWFEADNSESIIALSLAISGTTLFAGTFDGINSRSVLELVTSVEDQISGLQGFNLAQNFPNPFNPTTKIQYSLPQMSNVTLKVYDLLGREVAALVNEEKHPGVYTVEFDGSNLASGVYLYRLAAGSFIQIKKLMLVK